MKIRPPDASLPMVDRVNEKDDAAGDFNDSSQQDQDQKKGREPPHEEVTDQNVGQAIEAFHIDSQAKAAGITAHQVGSGPGLKVVLKDGSGAVIRQLTGEEFLKLRETVGKNKNRGKILDQKL